MAEQNTRLGILLMLATTLVFAVQDGISRHLAENYNVMMVVMVRFWAFAIFVSVLAMRGGGGIGRAIGTRHPWVQTARGLILVAEICIMVVAFTRLGLIESHAVFTAYPLLVAALSGPVLGEKVGWRRWTAIGVGFIGVLIILEPGSGVFSVWALLPFVSALMFALYGLLTRYVARGDAPSVSFFWTGVVGAIGMTPFGLTHWTWMTPGDWLWMGTLCITAMVGHGLLIKAYAVAEASAVQPFAYLQLVWIAVLGFLLFDERLRPNVALGAAIVTGAGVFTLWREQVRARQVSRP
jgi:drug/metabolite transporter (DMT)-like permease